MISSRNIRLQKKKGVDGSQGQAAALLGERDPLEVVGKEGRRCRPQGLVEEWAKDGSRFGDFNLGTTMDGRLGISASPLLALVANQPR
ncbi:hypothetical protein PspLS_08616 [Pyricularia sp. CBS 133598]|nr:hypothetical protein PspLS_08616 [Pyricularia sp. CBS 133598]